MSPRPNLASLVTDFERHGPHTAIVASRGLRRNRTTYAELAHLSRRFAAELVQRGIAKGDRVVVWGENSAEWVAAFFGCVLRGVLPVPVDFASTPAFVSRVIGEVTPKLIVADRGLLQALGPRHEALILEDLGDTVSSQAATAIDDLSENDALQIIFTSGTTGDPKGVVHTHKNVLASLAPIEHEMEKYLKYERIFHPIRILHTLPLSHVFGQFMGLWVPALMAAEVHFESRLIAADLALRIREERISVLAAVPRVLDLMQTYMLGRYSDLAARLSAAGKLNPLQRWWRFRDVHRLLGLKYWAFVCGGASLSPAGEQFWKSLGFVVIQGYGMTETTALVSLNHPFRAVQGTIGQVLPGREVRLSDEGEVLVRGDTISNATWQHGRLQQGSSEWLATGDLAEFDAGGNLCFRGRKKDTIVTSSGLNIHPEDLEAALTRQPGVKASTVIETATEHGPEPLAVLVMNLGSDPASAVAAGNRELAGFQQIQRWLVWPDPDLPRTSTGKILRREVARRIASGEIGADTNGQALAPDLNLDSLGRVQLQSQLESQFGIALDDAAIQNVKTQEDLQQLIRQAPPAAVSGKAPAEHIYPRWPWHPVQQAIRTIFLETIAMPLVRFLGRPAVASRVTRWPEKPMLIVCNHVTSYDAALILFALPPKIRDRVAVAMSGEMLLDFRRGRNQGNWFLNLVGPIAYFLMTALFNVFPLPQLSGFRRSFRHAGEAVDRGYSVIVFPEGRRSDDGAPQPFKSGAGLLWKELGTPALAVHLSGLGELKTGGGRWFRSGKIGVTMGEILLARPGKSPEELTEILRDSVFAS